MCDPLTDSPDFQVESALSRIEIVLLKKGSCKGKKCVQSVYNDEQRPPPRITPRNYPQKMKPYRRSEGGTFYVEFSFRGKRHRVCTHTKVKRQAELVAKRLRQAVVSGDMGLAWQIMGAEETVTVGKIETVYKAANVVKKATAAANVNSMKWLSGLPDTSPITEFRMERIMAVRKEIMDEPDLRERRKKMTSFNSRLRMTKSIFSRRHRHIWGAIGLPSMDWIHEAPYFPSDRTTFRMPPESVLKRVDEGLGVLEDKPLFTAILLARAAGLRAGEIANAVAGWLVPSPMGIRVDRTSTWQPKSGQSRFIPLAPAVYARLGKHEDAGEYLVKSPRRINVVYRDAPAWLRERGVTAIKPLHELRKVFGATIATRSGIYAAQKLLGHSSPELTARVYSDLIAMPDAVALDI